MNIDDLIAGFSELESYRTSRFDWNAVIQLDPNSPFPAGNHMIRLVPGFGGPANSYGQFQMLLASAGEIVPAGDDNPGRTPTERFIVTVFREAPEMIEVDRGPHRQLPIGSEGDVHGKQWPVRLDFRTIYDPARACIMVLRKLRHQIESSEAGRPLSPSPAMATQSPQPASSVNIVESRATPVRSPREPSVRRSIARAARDWFLMDRRTLIDCINKGTIAAEQVSAKSWQFELEEIRQHNPTAAETADPQHPSNARMKQD